MLNQMLSCGGKNCKTYKYNIMKFIVSTIKEINGKPLFRGAYKSTVKCKNIHGQEFTKEVWCIDINSLEEFYVLVKEYGNLALFCEGFYREEILQINLFDEVCGA